MQNLKITNKGRALLSKIVNQPLTLTHMSLGKGNVSQFNPEITQLVSEVLKKEIEYCLQEDDGIYVRTTFTNQEVVTGFYVNEIGIYAMDPDEGEILYAYTNAYGESTDYFNPETAMILREIIEVKIVFANATDVQLIIDPGKVFITIEEMESKLNERSQLDDIAFNSQAGLHGMRYYNEKLNYYNGINWVVIQTGSSSENDATLKSILKIKMRQSGLNSDTNAWSDTLEDVSGINQALSSNYAFDTVNKSVKFSSYDANHVGIWKFDEASGSSCNPSKGSAVGTCYGTTIVDGVNGKARSFNGSSDKITFNEKVIPQGAKTIRFRMKQNGNPANDKAILCCSTSLASGANGDVVRLTTSGYIWYLLGQNSTFIINLMSAKNVCDNNWHDIMITWDGTTSVGAVKLYVDDISSPELGTATTTQTTVPTNNLQIGYDYATPTSYYGGVIDEVEISNVVRGNMPSVWNSGTATVVWNQVVSESVLNKALVESVYHLGSGSINFYLSRDGGTTFYECSPDVMRDISAQPIGTEIVLKVMITGESELFAIAWGGE